MPTGLFLFCNHIASRFLFPSVLGIGQILLEQYTQVILQGQSEGNHNIDDDDNDNDDDDDDDDDNDNHDVGDSDSSSTPVPSAIHQTTTIYCHTRHPPLLQKDALV